MNKSEARTSIIQPQLKARKLWNVYMMKQEKLYIKEVEFLYNINDWQTIIKSLQEDLETLQEWMIIDWSNEIWSAYLIGAEIIANSLDMTAWFWIGATESIQYWEKYSAMQVKWVDLTTKNDINKIITQGLEDWMDYKQVSRAIQEKFADWSKWRTELIASQEIWQAYESWKFAQIQEAKKTMVQQIEKRYITQWDSKVSDICLWNEAQWWIKESQMFSSGVATPLAHIGCRCYCKYRAV